MYFELTLFPNFRFSLPNIRQKLATLAGCLVMWQAINTLRPLAIKCLLLCDWPLSHAWAVNAYFTPRTVSNFQLNNGQDNNYSIQIWNGVRRKMAKTFLNNLFSNWIILGEGAGSKFGKFIWDWKLILNVI